MPNAARKYVTALMAEWSKRCPLKGDDGRAARLAYISEVIQRKVQSANDLNERELSDVLEALKTGRRGDSVSRPSSASLASSREVWKIRQLEIDLGWSEMPERLSGLLQQFCGVRYAQDLTHEQAWKVIEALKKILAGGRSERRRPHPQSPAA